YITSRAHHHVSILTSSLLSFKHPPTSELYTLSLHDALPISTVSWSRRAAGGCWCGGCGRPGRPRWAGATTATAAARRPASGWRRPQPPPSGAAPDSNNPSKLTLALDFIWSQIDTG